MIYVYRITLRLFAKVRGVQLRLIAILLSVCTLLSGTSAFAQVHQSQIGIDRLPNQLSIVGLYTYSDYSLQYASGATERARLYGGTAEYAWRRFYPWQAVASVHYAKDDLFNQTLYSAQAGAGYIHAYDRFTPFVNLQVGISKTESDQWMYLYRESKTGFSETLSVGSDYLLTPHWAVRPFQIQNQYLPFGSRHSVYWDLGAGVTYRFVSNK